MKKIFKQSNLIILLLVVYIAKSFIQSPTLFDYMVVVLMSLSFLFKLYLDKDELTDKKELIAIIAQNEEESNKKIEQFVEKYNDRLFELKKAQDNDRLAAETKFSTLNLGLQRSVRQPQEKSNNGWR